MKTMKHKTAKNKTAKKNLLRALGMSSFIPMFMNMLNTVKLYHWKTTSYSTHKATDHLYTDLNNQIDGFVEILLGKPEFTIKKRNSLLDIKLIKMKNYNNNEAFKKEIEVYKNFLINLSNNKSFNIPANADLINKKDEILGTLNQFLYLLTLEN